jgi:hypothetical protein
VNSRNRGKAGLALTLVVRALLAALLQESSQLGQPGAGYAEGGNGELLSL